MRSRFTLTASAHEQCEAEHKMRMLIRGIGGERVPSGSLRFREAMHPAKFDRQVGESEDAVRIETRDFCEFGERRFEIAGRIVFHAEPVVRQQIIRAHAERSPGARRTWLPDCPSGAGDGMLLGSQSQQFGTCMLCPSTAKECPACP